MWPLSLMFEPKEKATHILQLCDAASKAFSSLPFDTFVEHLLRFSGSKPRLVNDIFNDYCVQFSLKAPMQEFILILGANKDRSEVSLTFLGILNFRGFSFDVSFPSYKAHVNLDNDLMGQRPPQKSRNLATLLSQIFQIAVLEGWK